MTVDPSLHTNNTIKRSLVLPLMYSRDDATILKSRKLQKFSTEKRRKKLNAGERKFERVLLKLRMSFPSLQALHLLPYVLLGDQPVVLTYPSTSVMNSLPLWLSSFCSPPMMIFKWNQLQMQSEPHLLMQRIPLYARPQPLWQLLCTISQHHDFPIDVLVL